MEQTECSKTSAYKIQTPGNHPKESIQHSQQGESFKSRILHLYGEEITRHVHLLWTYHYEPCNLVSLKRCMICHCEG